MDILFFLSSINKISLLAFFITLGFLIYEVYLLSKQILIKKEINVPQFTESRQVAPKIRKILSQNKGHALGKRLLIVILLVFILILLAGITFWGVKDLGIVGNKVDLRPTPIINIVNSKGIVIFDEKFNELHESDFGKLKAGDKIIIGVKTVEEADIEAARIRVNSNSWDTQSYSKSFDKKNGVFYREYVISSDEAQLKIEAQLYSKLDGWLGK